MLKETGYDEYLVQQIKLGRDDIKAGRVISFEDAKQHWQRTLGQKALEIAEQNEELEKELIYG
ncbi:hypothetical protein [Necropsobacter massiliensis]|uniref:hypothetical protein n=1 Tax=Necropsobacter massiliensis TaxID=1400001 RepID=UPI000596233A|nr:hypothetical protein [Necropsobacter massiliensis]